MKLRQWQSDCIAQAYKQYCSGNSHFLCLATPGAGKTLMASQLTKQLFDSNLIELVICFSPSIVVANDFRIELEFHTSKRLDGSLGAAGRSLTYQGMLSLSNDFWDLFLQYRVFVIFDEIHHCAGHGILNANAWGQQIMSNIQGRAAFTLALTGTPWRSDSIPIALSSYCKEKQHIHCDYSYGLKEAVSDRVCRTPKFVLIDNDEVLLKMDGEIIDRYRSFSDLLTNTEFNYQSLIESEDLLGYLLKKADQKLNQLRLETPDAGGLIVATSVAHARQLLNILKIRFGEEAAIATYLENDAPSIIQRFKQSNKKWIISVGMISEGTNIPRLRVCCHLTRVKTELYFRQVLGRILRSNGTHNDEAYFYMPAEPTLVEYAYRVDEDIPTENIVKFDLIPRHSLNKNLSEKGSSAYDQIMKFDLQSLENQKNTSSIHINNGDSLLSKDYDTTINIFGKFKHEVLALNRINIELV